MSAGVGKPRRKREGHSRPRGWCAAGLGLLLGLELVAGSGSRAAWAQPGGTTRDYAAPPTAARPSDVPDAAGVELGQDSHPVGTVSKRAPQPLQGTALDPSLQQLTVSGSGHTPVAGNVARPSAGVVVLNRPVDTVSGKRRRIAPAVWSLGAAGFACAAVGRYLASRTLDDGARRNAALASYRTTTNPAEALSLRRQADAADADGAHHQNLAVAAYTAAALAAGGAVAWHLLVRPRAEATASPPVSVWAAPQAVGATMALPW